MTLAEIRDARLRIAIASQIRHYVGGDHKRGCAWCGKSFTARQRFHFLCSDNCRKGWHRGVFRPKHGNEAKKARAA